MKYTFKNDLKNNEMVLTISIRKRTQYNQDLEIVKWKDVQEIVSKNYTCPSSHVLGECKNHLQHLHGDYDKLCESSWVYELHEKIHEKKPSRPVKAKKTSTTKRKKTASK